MSKIDLYLIDNSNNIIEEINLIKPNTYQEFLEELRQKYQNFIKYYEIFKLDNNNKEIKINNEEKYIIIEDILFIRKIDENILGQSLFELNYNKLSESKQEVIDEKYNCILCSLIIKNENPYLCYRCQSIFHEKCLKEWDKKSKNLNQKLCCPKCRNELPLEQWNKKLDYEDNRKDNANLMNKINEYKLHNNMYNNINIIKDKKINEYKEKYEKYIEKTFEIFKNILNQINSIHSLLNLKNNRKLDNLINKLSLKFEYLELSDISNVIEEELKQFENYILENKIKLNENNSNNNLKNKNEISNINQINMIGNNNIIDDNFSLFKIIDKKGNAEEEDQKENEEEEKEGEEEEGGGSIYALKGAKKPLSLYTRRVMDISNIKAYLNLDSTAGRCSGQNLGNTSFMNSSIACLSNCTELTYYFLIGDYKKDINVENALGMGGDLARSWEDLLHQYWVEETWVGDPSGFKNTICRKAFEFKEDEQQDSHEFICTFLEYLNEDLNRTTNKPYIEMKEKGIDETDIECARRYWDYNLKRNDSIITDLFCGQFKSFITCPECGFINITFTPFETLKLPLMNKDRNKIHYFVNFDLYYIPKFCLRKPYHIIIKNLPESTMFKSVIERIKKDKECPIHNKLDKIFSIDMYNNKFFGNVKNNNAIRQFNCNNEYIFTFPFNKNNDEMQIPVYFYGKEYINNKENMSIYPRMIFGKSNMTLGDLKKNIYFNLRKYILSPFLKSYEDKDEISLEIEKYIEDKNYELDDNKLYDLIEKEYQDVFKNYQQEEEEQYIEKFRKDIPFRIFLLYEGDFGEIGKIPFVDENNFTKLSSKFKDYIKLNSFNDTFEDLDINDYSIIVEFNEESNYINKQTFDLNFFEKYEMEFKINNEDEEEDDDDKMTLKECIKNFCKEEQLEEGNEWYCSSCKNHVLAKKKLELFYLPKILIICFKRFIKDSEKWEKKEDFIDFPINNMDMNEFVIGPDKEHSKYDLFAVSQHHGSSGYGNYTAVCKNNGQWFSYYDSSCIETNENSVLSSAAYVLFYRRQTD